jgi:aspartate carbamoyltransferase regulatory subunit
MSDNTLSVNAVENGTVIDHIPSGQAWKIVTLLKILKHKYRVTLGLNLPSPRLGMKDIIKVEGKALSTKEAHDVAIFAPGGTINIVENYHVINKVSANLPKRVRGVLVCPNKRCITNHEPVVTEFAVKAQKEEIFLTCHHCEKSFERDAVHDPH